MSFKKSDFGQTINNLGFSENGHILGDSAYPLTEKILTPYKDNGHLTNIERNYNIKLAQNRSIIKHTFALLKGLLRGE